MSKLVKFAAAGAAVVSAFGVSAALLPAEYQEVEWIESTGQQSIDLGFAPDKLATGVVMDFNSGTYANQTAFFGTGWNNNCYLFNQQSDVYKFHGNNVSLPAKSPNCDMTLTIVPDGTGDGTLTIDNPGGTAWQASTNTVGLASSGNLKLFGLGNSNKSSFRLYRLTVTARTVKPAEEEEGEDVVSHVPVHDFVPCYRIEDGVIGLYDLLAENPTAAFKVDANNSATKFKKGEDVCYPDELTIAGAPSEYGEVSPAYGRQSGVGVGAKKTLTAPATVTLEGGKSVMDCVGYVVTADGSEVSSDTFAVGGETRSVEYTHPNNETGATFTWKWMPRHAVTVTAGEGGTASAADEWVSEGGTTTLTATPNDGYRFLRWKGNVPGPLQGKSPLTVVVLEPLTVEAEFIACASGELTAKTWNGGNQGDWDVAANWYPAGVPTTADAVSIASGTVTIRGRSAQAGSLTVAAGVKLFFGCSGSFQSSFTPLEATAADDLQLFVRDGLTINGQFAMAGEQHDGRTFISVGGDLALGANAQMAVYGGAVEIDAVRQDKYVGDGATVLVGGDLAIASGAWIYPYSHSVNGGSPAFGVAGDVTIAANGGFDAESKGWTNPNGFGYLKGNGDGSGGSHGGWGGVDGAGVVRKDGLIYDFVNAPVWPGSSGSKSGTPRAGGTVRLHTGGSVTVEGSLLAGVKKATGKTGGSAGGSVWVTCSTLTTGASAMLSVKGGDISGGGYDGGGGGGRLAILTGSPTEVQLQELYATGTCGDLVVLTTNVCDVAESPYATQFNISKGMTSSHASKDSTDGTGVILANATGKKVLHVAVLPDPHDVVAPVSDPLVGNAVVAGEFTATVMTPNFVPGSDSRSRFHSLKCDYRNSEGTADEVTGDDVGSYLFNADAADEHWITWTLGDLEHLLRVDVSGENTVSGGSSAGAWHDADSVVTLTPIAAEGYKFASWSGEVPAEQLTQNPLLLTMDRPRDISAVFVPEGGYAGELSAAQNGGWLDAATWGGAGVPGSATDVVIDGKTVTIAEPVELTVKSITLKNAAKLVILGTGTAYDTIKPVVNSETWPKSISFTVIESVALAGTSFMSVGGQNATYCPTLVIGGDLSLANTSKLAVYGGEVTPDADDPEKYVGDGAQVEIAGNLTTASGTWIYPFSHGVTGGSVRWTVGGDVTIAENSGFNADGLGWQYPNGLGCFHPGVNGAWVEGQGGSYGGVGGTYTGNKRTYGGVYGFAFAPFWPGSPGEKRGNVAGGPGGLAGGGSIRLHVTGDVTLNGSLLARGAAISGNNPGAGSGGGVWVTCRAFSVGEHASINVKGADGNTSYCSGGGGGRVAIMTDSPTGEQLEQLYATGTCDKLQVNSTDVNDPGTSPYPTLITLNPGLGKAGQSNPPAEAGTGAFLENLGDKASLTVEILPSSSQVSVPSSYPAAGNLTVLGEVAAYAITPSFVPNADSRQRRQCVGFSYSNAAGASVSGAETNYTFLSSSADSHTIVWDFGDLEYLLRTESLGSGKVEGNVDWYDANSFATLTAVPEDGFVFASWSGEVPTEQMRQNPLDIEMDVPRDIKAVFVPAGDGYEGTLTAGANGSWFAASTWGDAGVPGAGTDVVIDGKTVTLDQPVAMSVKSITLKNAAKLILYGKGTAVDAIKPCDFSASWRMGLDFTVADSVSLDNTSFLTLGGLNATYQPTLTVGGELTLAGTAKMAVYAGGTEAHDDWTVFPGDGAVVSIGGNLTLSGTANWIYPYAHYVYGETPRFVVAGDVTIAANCGFDANHKGWWQPSGFGYYDEPANEGAGGWHGGKGGWYSANNKPSDRRYGYAYAPFWPGSPGEKGSAALNPGGGAVRLHAEGAVALNGKLLAEGCGPTNKDGAGSGGSVWLTCDTFTPGANAVISAKGGSCTAGWAAGAGGGRVAIMTGKPSVEQLASLYETGTCDGLAVVAEDANDPETSPYPTLINVAEGASSGAASVKATAGTAVVLANSGGKRPLTVTILPSTDAVVAPACEPLAGMSLVSGEFTATVVSPNFVPNAEERTRLWAVGCVYSNSADMVDEQTGIAAYSFDASLAEEHWITWRMGNRQHLLRAEVTGEGELNGVGDWHAENVVVTITPVPSEGYRFVAWGGEVPVAQVLENPLRLTMDRPRDIKAYFAKDGEAEALEAVQSGEWFDATTWGDEGYVPSAKTAVTVGGSCAVALSVPTDVSVRSLALKGNASLKLWGVGTSVTAVNRLGDGQVDPEYDGEFTLAVKGSVTLADKAWLSIGGKLSNYRPNVTINEALSLTNTAKLAVYAGAVSRDDLVRYAAGGAKLTVGRGIDLTDASWVYPFCHSVSGAPVVFKARTVDIAENCGFNAERAGFDYRCGPGSCYVPAVNRVPGASYGGVNSRYEESSPAQATYGNPCAPFWAGSSASTGVMGGGAIIIEATKSVTLAGALDADASKDSAGSGLGSGGSVWVRCRTFTATPTARVTAKGGSNTWAQNEASGGGRICIIEGRPSESLLSRYILAGDTDQIVRDFGAEVRCANLANALSLEIAGLSDYEGVFSAARGQQNTTDHGYLHLYDATDGSAVWLKAKPAGLSIMVR